MTIIHAGRRYRVATLHYSGGPSVMLWGSVVCVRDQGSARRNAELARAFLPAAVRALQKKVTPT